MNTSTQLGESVVMVSRYARMLNQASASGNEDAFVYEIATNIMLECQRIREVTQNAEIHPRVGLTVQDIISRITGNISTA